MAGAAAGRFPGRLWGHKGWIGIWLDVATYWRVLADLVVAATA